MATAWHQVREGHSPRCSCVFCCYGPGAATGAFTPPVVLPAGDPPICVNAPYVSGDGIVGEILSSTMGLWEGMEDGTYAYAWFSDGVSVGTDASYTVADTDAGNDLTCVVTGTNASGSTASPPSNVVSVAAEAKHRETKHHAKTHSR